MNARPMLLAALIAVTACTGGERVAESTGTEPPVETTAVETALDPVGDAVAALLEAESYAFDASVALTVSDERVDTDLEGWVDGDARELVVRSGDESVITRVVAGVATVERNGKRTEIPVTEAGGAPSLTILSDIENLVETSTGEFRGSLTAEALRGSGFDDSTPVTITITLAADGQLAGYSLASSDGAWSAIVTFDGIGESYTS